MTPILPGKLYLGSMNDARAWQALQDNGITAIINLTSEPPSPHIPEHIETYWHPLWDGPGNSATEFANAAKTLLLARECNKCVLVHCRMGISRSSTLVATYLAETTDALTFDTAVDLLKKMRPIVMPHYALRKLARAYLQEPDHGYEEEL